MSRPSPVINIYIEPSENCIFVAGSIAGKLDKEVVDFFKSIGIRAKIVPPPYERGGGVVFSLIQQILNFLITLIGILRSAITFYGEGIVHKKSPLFTIHLHDDTCCEGVVWENDDDTAERITSLVLHNWQLIDYFRKKYPYFEFEGISTTYSKPFGHSVEVCVPGCRARTGYLLKFLENIKVKTNVYENISLTSLFVVDHIFYVGNDDNPGKLKKLLYILGTRSRGFSAKSRRVIIENTSRGRTLAPTE